MPTRTATAHWEGAVQDGKGRVALESGAFEGPYSFSSRFSEERGTQTNPDELLGAAHASCFTLALSGALTRAGHPPTRIDTTAEVTVRNAGGDITIPTIVLTTEAEVPGMSEEDFLAAANGAKENCPVSKALAGVEITLEAHLAG